MRVRLRVRLRVGVMCILPAISVIALAQVPVINSVTPASGKVGSVVTINGNNFSAVPGQNTVYFGGGLAQVVSASTTKLKVLVPSTATYKPVTVTTGGLTAFSRRPFDLTFNPTAPITDTSFASMEEYDIDTGLQSSLMGDFDRDGRLDLVTVSFSTMQVAIFPNTSTPGNISFGETITFPTTTNLNEVALADIDGDGKLDIVVANLQSVEESDSTITVYRNTSSVGAISFQEILPHSFVGFLPTCVAVDDIDGDGRPDIASASFGDGTATVLRNISSPGNVAFEEVVEFDNGGGVPHTVALGDLDGDGLADMIVANTGLEGLLLFRNESNPGNISFADPELMQFTYGSPDTTIEPLFVTLGDIDGDGKLDLLVSENDGPNLFASRNINPGPGSFAFDTPVHFRKGAGLGWASLSDVNGDGCPDIITGNSSDNTISVFQNIGSPGAITTGSFKPHVDFDAAAYPIRVAAGDLDGDGHPELAAPSFTDISVSISRNLLPDGYVRAGVKALLQGPYSATPDTMSTLLGNSGILTTHFGSGAAPQNAVDSINIELRNDSTAAGSTIRRFKPAWLMKDGTIRNFDEPLLSFVDFDTVSPGSYYLVLRHRNHLGVMTKQTTSLTSVGSVYDFTTAEISSFGASPLIKVGSRFCLYAGDAGSDGQITTLDFTPWLAAARAAVVGYSRTDFNCDGQNTSSDFTVWLSNARSGATSQIP
jgi:hypothetical protein